MRVLLEAVRRGEYEIWGVMRHEPEALPAILVKVIHYRSQEAIAAILEEIGAELGPPPPPASPRASIAAVSLDGVVRKRE